MRNNMFVTRMRFTHFKKELALVAYAFATAHHSTDEVFAALRMARRLTGIDATSMARVFVDDIELDWSVLAKVRDDAHEALDAGVFADYLP